MRSATLLAVLVAFASTEVGGEEKKGSQIRSAKAWARFKPGFLRAQTEYAEQLAKLHEILADVRAPDTVRVDAARLLRTSPLPSLLENAVKRLDAEIATDLPQGAQPGAGDTLPYYLLAHDRRLAITPQILGNVSGGKTGVAYRRLAATLLGELWPAGTARAMVLSWIEVAKSRGADVKPLEDLAKRIGP